MSKSQEMQPEHSTGEPRACNHEAISPKGTMFYHGFVVPTANLWRCDVCKGVYEGNLTDPKAPGSQGLTLVSSAPPPVPDAIEAAARARFLQNHGLPAHDPWQHAPSATRHEYLEWARRDALTKRPDYCKCSFTDDDGTVVPGESCPLHPEANRE